MNHPTREALIEHLYGENDSAARAEIHSHLETCAECRAKTDGWRETMSALDHWKLPNGARGSLLAPMFRWAAAAAILITVGYAAGRIGSPNSGALQAMIQREVAQQVSAATQKERTAVAEELRTIATQSIGDETRQLLTSLVDELDQRRRNDAETFLTAVQQIDTRHTQEVTQLRKDLGTVAFVADARLSDIQEQLDEPVSASTSIDIPNK